MLIYVENQSKFFTHLFFNENVDITINLFIHSNQMA
jgi:hypothetical protein